MHTGWILWSLVVLLFAQNSLADGDIGFSAEDDIDAPPPMNSSSEGGKSTTRKGVIGKEKKTDDGSKEKESNATGSVEKGDTIASRVKTIVLPLLNEKNGKSTTSKEVKTIDLSNDKIVKDTTKADKMKIVVRPLSAENDAKESAEGVKIVTTANKNDKMKKEEKDASTAIVAPSNVKNATATDKEKANTTLVKSESTQETTVKDTTTVATTVKVALSEDSEEKKGAMVDGEGETGSDETEEPEGDQVTEGKTEEKKAEEKKDEKGEEKRPYPIQPIKAEYYSDSHFFSFFIFFLVFSAVGYLAYHNKRKIMALVIEGRSGKGDRVRYHRLANDENFERNIIY